MRRLRFAGSNQSQSVTSPDRQQAHYDLSKKWRQNQVRLSDGLVLWRACISSLQSRTSRGALPMRLLFELIRSIVRQTQGPQLTLPTTVYAAAGCPLSRCPLTKV